MKFVTDIFAKAGLIVDGSVTLNTTPNANIDTDKFLVQDGAIVKYRTGAEVLSDIGAQGALTLTVIGNSGPSTLISNTLNVPTYTLAGLGGVPLTRTLTINGVGYDLSSDRSWSVGTVTSVDMSVPTGFAISGNPITASGTLALAFASGYSLPTVASQLNWTNAYNNSITAISYNTSTGEIVLTQQDLGTLNTFVTLQPFSTTNLAEGTNLYYTDVRARLALSAGVGISYNNLTGVITNSDLGSSQNIFKNIAVATQNTIVADSNNDTLTFAAGVGVGLTTDDTTDTLTITNTAPDQTVVLTGGGTTSISGTYPNFTITSNDQYVGTVTSFSAGNLSPLFTTSVATGTTTPALSFTLNTQNSATVFAGPATGGAAAPTFRALQSTDIPALSYVSSIGVTAPITTTGGLTPTIGITQATALASGYLSAADWSVFNAKQDALTLTTTGSSGSSTLIGATLNIPTYTLSGLGGVPSTRTINGLALSADQTFATGTTGTDFNIVSAGTVHTFNIPDASATARGLITVGSQTIAGTKTFTSSPIVPSLYLTNMGAGSGAVYYNLSENRLTLANYNVGGEIKFEVNGGVYTMELNSDLTIELKGYTTDGFLKTSGGTGLLVVDTTTYTPTTRTLTINGTSYDLSANRTWSVGTVTSVGLSVPTGFSVTNSPVTSSGTLALSFASGYSLPTNASQTNWDTAYTNRITSLTTTGTSGAATLVANVLNIPQYQAQGNYITSLTGEATASGPGAASVTLTNSAVIGKVLTGLTVTSGSIASTDSILQAFGKVQGQINALSGGLIFQGTWNANTNTPTITSSVGTLGYFYIVNVAGNTTIDGNTNWQVGDWILFDGTVWQKVDNTDAVTSVNGQTGAVVLTTTNITEGTNLYYTDVRARLAISLTTTGSSGAATYSNVTGVLNIPQYTLSGLGGVPTSRTLTINGTAYDLSADRTWSVGTVTSIATTGPITGGTITGTGTIGITQASSTTDGYLSSANWTTFNNKQNAITLTTTGSSGASTLVGATLNIPEYTLSGLGGVPSTRTLTINGTSYDLSANRTWSVGTVTSITFSGPLTGGTITGSGTVGITQASGSTSGYLSNTDWTTFNNKQNAITLTTTGSSGAATLVGATLNIPTYSLSGLGGVPTSRTITINSVAFDLSADRSWSVGTVTSVAALTLGTSGSDVSSSVSNGTTTPVITLNIPTASATARGALSSTDWSTFNNKQATITLTTTGSSGAATFITNTLNIPNYTLAGLGGVPTTRTITINGTALDLSANRSWSVGTVTSVSATAGTGISVSGSPITGSGTLTITNTAPDQTVVLTAGTGISVSGTYPNFTITNSAPSPANTVTGTGTTNYVARWTSSSVIGTGILYDNGSVVCVNATAPEYTEKFRVVGGVTVSHAYTQVNALQRVGTVTSLTTTTAGGAGYYAGLSYTALTGYHENIFNGSVSIPNDVSIGGTSSTATIRFNASSVSVSMAQATGLRAYAVYDGMIAFSSSQSGGSISHAAVFHAKAPYYVGSNTPTITNFYGLLINDSTEYNTWVSVTNRWGVYQAGSTDNNYFNGTVLLGSTTNTGLAKLQVTGAIQQTSVTSAMLKTNSSGVLVAAVAGTDYLTATSSDFSYNSVLTLSTSWQNTGVSSANLTTSGAYIVTCFANDYSVGGSQYSCTYTGIMYWYAAGTNSVDTISEIALHHTGHHDGGRFIYLRTLSTLSADGKTYLQIKGNGNNSGNATYTLTFKRLM